MHGRTPGGEASWRPYTPAQIAEFKRLDAARYLANSKRPHAVCHHHGITKRDGSPRAFIDDDGGVGCNSSLISNQDEMGLELCRPFWQSIPACPMGDGCMHG